MIIALTGPNSFLGYHLRCLLKRRKGIDIVLISRNELYDEVILQRLLSGVDVLIHAAGIGRSNKTHEVYNVNTKLADVLATSLLRNKKSPHLLFCNSIHSKQDSEFGIGKRVAAQKLAAISKEFGSPFTDLLLPNIFGEFYPSGKYSVVANFCESLMRSRSPELRENRIVPLAYVGDVISDIFECIESKHDSQKTFNTTQLLVSELLERIKVVHRIYTNGPGNIGLSRLDLQLLNTLISHADHQSLIRKWGLRPANKLDSARENKKILQLTKGQVLEFESEMRVIRRLRVLRGLITITFQRELTGEVEICIIKYGEQVDIKTFWTCQIRSQEESELIFEDLTRLN